MCNFSQPTVAKALGRRHSAIQLASLQSTSFQRLPAFNDGSIATQQPKKHSKKQHQPRLFQTNSNATMWKHKAYHSLNPKTVAAFGSLSTEKTKQKVTSHTKTLTRSPSQSETQIWRAFILKKSKAGNTSPHSRGKNITSGIWCITWR